MNGEVGAALKKFVLQRVLSHGSSDLAHNFTSIAITNIVGSRKQQHQQNQSQPNHPPYCPCSACSNPNPAAANAANADKSASAAASATAGATNNGGANTANNHGSGLGNQNNHLAANSILPNNNINSISATNNKSCEQIMDHGLNNHYKFQSTPVWSTPKEYLESLSATYIDQLFGLGMWNWIIQLCN